MSIGERQRELLEALRERLHGAHWIAGNPGAPLGRALIFSQDMESNEPRFIYTAVVPSCELYNENAEQRIPSCIRSNPNEASYLDDIIDNLRYREWDIIDAFDVPVPYALATNWTEYIRGLTEAYCDHWAQQSLPDRK